MKKFLFFLILLLFLLYSAAWAVDLNAPAEKKVTVGSEIRRGTSAITDASLNIKGTDHLGRLQAFSAVFDRNQQANTDTQAFRLGASLGALISLDVTLNLAAQNPNSMFYPAREIQLVEVDAKDYFKEVRKIQKELNIDDQTLIQATPFKPDLLKASLYRWDKKSK
jgi:hypothetical protein